MATLAVSHKTSSFNGTASIRPTAAARPAAYGRPRCVRVTATIVIGLAADSGCGKSTFMRRMTNVFGGSPKPPAGGNPDSNTLISDITTVICLDDYHCLDRNGRKKEGVTALDSRAQNFGEPRVCLPAGFARPSPLGSRWRPCRGIGPWVWEGAGGARRGKKECFQPLNLFAPPLPISAQTSCISR